MQSPNGLTDMLPRTSAPPSTTHKPPTAADIPPVALTNVPHVDIAAFSPYITQVGALWDDLQRARRDQESETWRNSRKEQDQVKDEDFAEKLERGLGGEPISQMSPSATIVPNKVPRSKRRMVSGLSKSKMEAAPLSIVPLVYSSENFQLENPRTFNIVSEGSEVARKPQTPSTAEEPSNSMESSSQEPGKTLVTNAILQEKLSWYMDIVEVHLISAISTAFTSFFATLGSLQDLQSEATESAQRVQSLRADLNNLDTGLALGGLKAIKMKRRRDNMRKLCDASAQLNGIVQAVAHCEKLVDQGDYVLALDRLDLVDKLVSGGLSLDGNTSLSWLNTFIPSNLVDLRKLKSLDGRFETMQQLRYRIGRGFEARFLETLLADLRQHVQNVPARDTLQRWVSDFQRKRGNSQPLPSELPAYMKENPQVRHDLGTCLLGLHQSRYTLQATAALREVILKEMKALIRQHLPNSSGDDNDSKTPVFIGAGDRTMTQHDKSAALARNLRALDPVTAERLFARVYTNVGEALRRLSYQLKVMIDITSSTESPPFITPSARSAMRSLNLGTFSDITESLRWANSTISPNELQEELPQTLDMLSLLGQAVDIAQTQITKVLKVRSEQTVKQPLAGFLRYFYLNRLFVDECEAISGCSGAALKGVINNQASEFIQFLSDSAKQQLTFTMDVDKWEPKIFEPEEQAILASILDGMTLGRQDWLNALVTYENFGEVVQKRNDLSMNDDVAAMNGARNAIIDGQSFVLVESATAALRGIDQFANLIVAIPSKTTEASDALLGFLKLFNSRSCQLILGAGARHTAGLKSITTKNLALASQALSFVTALMPYLKELVRRHAVNSPFLVELDKVKRLYQDHQASIHEKLIDMMSSRATANANAMKIIEWDTDTQETSHYMKTLTDDTSIFHRVLGKCLPDNEVISIVTPVFQSYKAQLGKAFDEAVVKTPQGKSRLVADMKSFLSN